MLASCDRAQMEPIVLLMQLILLIMQLPLLIAKSVLAFMADMVMVIPYAQYVAEGFVLLITTIHGFRYILVYVYKDDHTLPRSRSVLDII